MKTNQSGGAINVLLIPFILVDILLIVAVIFGVWAYHSRQDYKNHTDQKVSSAVAANTKKIQQTDVKQYAQEAKKPLKTYTGPSAFGTIVVQYPKTWSAYVAEGGTTSSDPIEGYFQPGFVPDINGNSNTFALRVQLTSQAYDQILQSYTDLAKQGKVKIQPYTSANIASNVFGVRIDGQITQNAQGSMIVLPLRNMTFEMSTESKQFESDFNNIILPNFSFRP
ncbi:MAG: hypothetical protein ACREGA_02715 [Candidatus Saccharimonadales bacterium]